MGFLLFSILAIYTIYQIVTGTYGGKQSMSCNKCGNKVKFKNKYVLGKGYPQVNSTSKSFIGLVDKANHNAEAIQLNYFSELAFEDTPKYQLVLERIK